MKKIFPLLYLWITPLISICQEIYLADELLRMPVLITLNNGSTGSGIFMQDSSNIFLITARHVLFDEGTNRFIPESLKLKYYPKNITDGDTSIISIDFRKMKDSLVRFDKQHDIAIIKIAHIEKNIGDTAFNVTLIPYLKTIYNVTTLNQYPSKMTKKYSQIKIGTDIYLFGYPSSLGTKWVYPQSIDIFDYDRPLLRSGIIAGKNDKLKTIIIDAPSYWGNSGGPVFIKQTEFLQVSYHLVGIVSGFIPFYDYIHSDKSGTYNLQVSNSGYSIIIPIEFAINLMKDFK